MSDRRNFLAQVGGVLAGLIASQHIDVPAAEPPKPVVGKVIYSVPAPDSINTKLSYDERHTFEIVGPVPDGCVTLDGVPCRSVYRVKVAVGGQFSSGDTLRGHGLVSTWQPIADRDMESVFYSLDCLAEWTYEGLVSFTLPPGFRSTMTWFGQSDR